MNTHIECSAGKAHDEERARIRRNLNYWRQVRIHAAGRDKDDPCRVYSWEDAYQQSVRWEEHLNALESEYTGHEQS